MVAVDRERGVQRLELVAGVGHRDHAVRGRDRRTGEVAVAVDHTGPAGEVVDAAADGDGRPDGPVVGRLDRVLHDPARRLVHAPLRLHRGRRGRRRSDDDRRRSRGATGGDGQTDRCPDARQDCSAHGDAPIVSVVVTCAGPPRFRRTSPPGWHAIGGGSSRSGMPPWPSAGFSPPSAVTRPQRVNVVPHTHWDREWYRTFQDLRLALVEVLDDLLDDLAGDLALTHFLLDGQVAAVDDYLELRPEREAELRAHLRSGRVATGPWYTLPDEFLVSGETLVRDLELGMDRADELAGREGAAMAVGYLPDTFGHIAQMPQLLARAGLDHAVVWRGVPARGRPDRVLVGGAGRHRPCGPSTCRTGYGNGARMPDDPSALPRPARRVGRARRGPRPRRPDPVDERHRPPPPPARSAAAARRRDRGECGALRRAPDLAAASTSPARPRTACPGGGASCAAAPAPTCCPASPPTGSTSARPRREPSGCSSRRPSPCGRPSRRPGSGPGGPLDVAWKAMVRNAAHDSVCACSHDEVVDAVHHRYAEARQIGEALRAQGLRLVGAALAGDEPGRGQHAGPHARRAGPGRPGPAIDPSPASSSSPRPRRSPSSTRCRPRPRPRCWSPSSTSGRRSTGWPSSTRTTARSSCTCRPTGPLAVASRRGRASTACARWPRRSRTASCASRWPTPRAATSSCGSTASPATGGPRSRPRRSRPSRRRTRRLANGLASVEVDAETGTFALDGHARPRPARRRRRRGRHLQPLPAGP